MSNTKHTNQHEPLNADDGEGHSVAEDEGDEQEFPELPNSAKEFNNGLLGGSIQLESLQDSDIVMAISKKINEEKKAMENRRTAKLWLQYLDMVEILLIFIKAERTGNWNLHLIMNSKMLPYLAAAGHNKYTKSLFLYLQTMEQLCTTQPEAYQHFQQGLHVIRSDRYLKLI